MAVESTRTPKPVHWMGSSRNDLRKLPAEVSKEIGYALWFAQVGDKHPSAKPLKGFQGAGVLEVVEDYAGDTYRRLHSKIRQSGLRPACIPEKE